VLPPQFSDPPRISALQTTLLLKQHGFCACNASWAADTAVKTVVITGPGMATTVFHASDKSVTI